MTSLRCARTPRVFDLALPELPLEAGARVASRGSRPAASAHSVEGAPLATAATAPAASPSRTTLVRTDVNRNE